MTKINDGGPAFPHDNQELGDRHRVAQPGMTLRDYFAGQALAGMLANQHTSAQAFAASAMPGAVASFAYTIADAMIVERERGKP